MLTSIARLCVRNGRKASVHAACLPPVSPLRNSPDRLNLTGSRHLAWQRSPGPLTPAAWSQLLGLTARSASRGAADPLGSEDSAFGSLSADLSSRRSFKKSSPDIRDQVEEEEAEEERETSGAHRRPGRRNTQYWYFLQCKKLIKENKLQQALDVFNIDMLQGERLQPEEFNYSVLIGGCGRAGQLQQAFRLYNDMKKRGLTAKDATYTALFNACAQSPRKQVGLQQALKLEQELRRKNYPLSSITYHALLKTHAMTNHLQACVHILREMLQNGHVVTQETFHYLLMASLKDKDAGFRLALQVWSQMLRSGIVPDSQNYNLLLRCARDCGIGDPALASSVLLGSDWENHKERTHGTLVKSGSQGSVDIDLMERRLFTQPGDRGDGSLCFAQKESFSRQDSKQLVPVRAKENVPLPCELADSSTPPNLLDYFEGKRGAVVSLGTVSGASDRLALIGGAKGFLGKMEVNGLCPDLRTLSLLADTMEPGTSLQMLLKVAKQHNVKLDVAFFNSVIRRAARARDLDGAKAVLSVMRQRHLQADVQTYGSLALGCERWKDGLQLLKDMEETGLRPNVYIFSALIGRASQRLDYIYLKKLLESMRNLEVWPNDVIIKQLEFAAQYPPNYDQFKSRNNYLVHINGFRGYYQEWLRSMPAESADEEPELESGLTVLKSAPDDGLTEAKRNETAAARRYFSRNKDNKNKTLPSL
ncbi:pentatricopeptide repeat-containing protein 1, mitochondrial [Genypterus blacodes]|uniref:pentatricopeptide repeat-containing protein 1, mitochondrial n=1 Tax=Genypterus blacodes TaxID=154954 RepID=UPI003F7741C9